MSVHKPLPPTKKEEKLEARGQALLAESARLHNAGNDRLARAKFQQAMRYLNAENALYTQRIKDLNAKLFGVSAC